jgi:hypothetical protein
VSSSIPPSGIFYALILETLECVILSHPLRQIVLSSQFNVSSVPSFDGHYAWLYGRC